MPMYDFTCDVCETGVEVVVPIADRDKPIPHKEESELTECLGMLRRDGITGTKLGGMGDVKLDGRHQTKAVMYDGERKVGHVDGHFGKEAKRYKK